MLRDARDKTSHTNQKCKRGNGLASSLTLRVSVPSGRMQYSVRRLQRGDYRSLATIESFGSSPIDRPTLARHYQCVCVRESQVSEARRKGAFMEKAVGVGGVFFKA